MSLIKKVNFDHAAAEDISRPVLDYIDQNKAYFYNASSFYLESQYGKSQIEKARIRIAQEINCDPEEIIFTSGASESNALAIDGYLKANTENDESWCFCTNIEHSSILDNPNTLPCLKCDRYGIILPSEVKLAPENGALFSIQYANNEIGIIQDIKELATCVHARNGVLHVDAAQAFGKIPIDVQDLGIDMMSASAGKMGGIRGVGFLYVKKGIKLEPIIYGTQESHLRGGTYFTLGIGAFGVAVEQIDYRKETILKSKRDYFINRLLEIKQISLNGRRQSRLANNINIRISGITLDSQQMVSILNSYGYMVSAGSACHAGDAEPSHVLKALGLTEDEMHCCIRISIGMENTVQDIDEFIEVLKLTINMHRKGLK